MTRKMLMMLAAMTAFACGAPEEDGWEFDDEPIVIWTIPRPGEEPQNNTVAEPPVDPANNRPVEPVMPGNNANANNTPDDPVQPRDPNLPGREPSAAPIACEVEYRGITAPGVIEGGLLRGRGDVDEVPCSTAAGVEQRFTIDVPRRMGVEIWTTYTETEFSPVLLLQSGCGEATVDLQCSGPLAPHPGLYSGHIRTVLEPGKYTLLVDERDNSGFGGGGRFEIHVDEFDVAHNGMCEAAETLYPDTTGVVSEFNGSTGDLRSCFGNGQSRRFYRINVGARSSVRVDAHYIDPPPNTSQGPSVEIRESCYDTCDGASDYDGVSIANESDEMRSYIVSTTGRDGLPYEVMMTRWESIHDNASCQDAMVLAAGQTVFGDLINGSAHQPICGSNESRQLFYSVEVPPYHRLIPEHDIGTLRVSQGCSADQCIASQPINETGVTQRYTIRMGDWNGRDAQFGLTPHVVPIADNSTCFAPRTVGVGESVVGDLVAGGEATGTCGLILNNGFTLWYEVEIPASTAVRIKATPISGDQHPYMGMHITEPTCGGACLDYFEPYLNGPGSATVEVSNDEPSPKTVFVAVASERMDMQAETIQLDVTEL